MSDWRAKGRVFDSHRLQNILISEFNVFSHNLCDTYIIKCANRNNNSDLFFTNFFLVHGYQWDPAEIFHMGPTWFPLGPIRFPHMTHIVPTYVPCGSHVGFSSRERFPTTSSVCFFPYEFTFINIFLQFFNTY